MLKAIDQGEFSFEAYKAEFKNSLGSLIEQGCLEEAKNAIQEYEKMVPNDFQCMDMKAIILMMEYKLDEAEQILLQGLDVEFTNFDLLYNLGYLYQMKGNIRRSVGYYELALLYSGSSELREQLRHTVAGLRGALPRHEKPLVSIVVLAYNKLDYTKLCIDSIYRYTMEIDYELIVVNNGSSDGTREYFNSLPNARIIHLPENIGPVNGFNVGLQAAEGKYTAGVCNDFIFTASWMENLLQCIESDGSIGFVSPGSSHISNLQQINGTYSNLLEMQQFAKRYNISAPEKWEERVRLLPNVLMVRTGILQKLGCFDPQYYFGEFADDDLALRIRRAGYKLVFLRDTFVFHFGSITTGENQRMNNSLEVSRKIFFDKHGIDAWEDMGFNPLIVDAISPQSRSAVRILGINTACGGTPLQLKNKCKENGAGDVAIWNITDDHKYVNDLKTVSDQVFLTSITDFGNNHSQETFDLIVFERGLEKTQSLEDALESLKTVLAEDGLLVIKADNPSFYGNLVQLLNGRGMDQANPISNYLHKDGFIQLLQESGFGKIQVTACRYDIPVQDQQIAAALGRLQSDYNLTLTEDALAIGCYLYFIQRT